MKLFFLRLPDPETAIARVATRVRQGGHHIPDAVDFGDCCHTALAADGTTVIHGAHHVHRGYENIERKFLDLGARIERVQEGETSASA